MNYRMAFLILHYNNLRDTKKCVASIRNMTYGKDSLIVIVDNASPNHTGSELSKAYVGEANTVVIQNEKNLGFSEGNNIGYRYIRRKYSVDFITVCNNDIVFLDTSYIEGVEKIYKESRFHIMGPDIYNPNLKIHQSPLGTDSPSMTDVLRTIRLNQIAERTFPLFWPLIGKREVEKAKNRKDSVKNYTDKMDDVPLMGACLVVSKDFIKVKKNVFEPRTFLYYEEYLLYNYCRRNGLKMVYRPEIKVVHNEGGATRTTSRDERERYKRLIHNIRKAAQIYYLDLKEYNNDNKEK